MINPPIASDRAVREAAVIERFLESPDEESFAGLFQVFTPQLVAFYRSRGCELTLSEDLTQEIMLTVYRKASQIRDRSLFVASSNKPAGTPAFEFHHWMSLLESREREALTLRFVEDWEYHEIAAAKNMPIGTIQWRVFNAKKKLAPYLKALEARRREAA
jgi:DNA-directed RNA polymerase specialized sigma24 family protein